LTCLALLMIHITYIVTLHPHIHICLIKCMHWSLACPFKAPGGRGLSYKWKETSITLAI
jgi:hypothetical protein